MFRRLRYLWAFLLAASAAVLLRGLYIALPCPATAVLSPICQSPWELSKLVYWPYLCGALLLWRLSPPETARQGEYCASALGASILMILLCRCLRDILPLHGIFCLSVWGGMALRVLLPRRVLQGSGSLWYLLAAFWGAAYLLLTALPPRAGIFLDPRDVSAMAPIPF